MCGLGCELVVLPRSKVGKQLLSASKGPTYRSVVSIGDPGSRRPAGIGGQRRAVLRLEFEDIEDPTDPMAPTAANVETIVEFASTVARLGGKCLVHCEAGVSRSTAAAAIIARVLLGEGAEAEALRVACEKVPDAAPNRLMLRLADELLENGGRLTRARAAYL